MTMKCFVASAFGHRDVDAIYRGAVQPVLREFRITPLRVDRVEHNEDIDDKIFSLLNDADICIADLTHARPSVYYEAGYAFGQGKPVIYIVRDDHFRARPDDPNGNQRVHFDLQMKNIIPWKSPDDKFRMRLRKRVKHVVAPLVRATKKVEAARAHAKEFSALPQFAQLRQIASKGRQLLFARGFKTVPYEDFHGVKSPFRLRFSRERSRIHTQVHFITCPSVAKNDIVRFRFEGALSSANEPARYDENRSILLIACLRATQGKTLAAWLPSFTPLHDNVFFQEEPQTTEKPRQVTLVVVIDRCKSVEDFAERLRAVAPQFTDAT